MPVVIDLSSRTAVVTGGGSGLGYAAAGALKSAGARVEIAGRREDVLRRASQSLACIPLGKAGNPRDVGNLTLFLATELSDYMTGELIRLDGSALS